MGIRPKFVSLFTGIGGLDLGLDRAGFRCAAQVEIDPWCRGILRRHWPRVPKFSDVRTFGRNSVNGHVDAICGGFPCQDISNAGRKAGIEGERSGLWKEMLRIAREFKPSLVLVENVSALRARGLEVVLADLAESGFDAEWDCLPAAAFGAPHVRDRIFIVAYAQRLGWACPAIFAGVPRPKPRSWPSNKVRGLIEARGRLYRAYPSALRLGDGLSAGMDRIKGCGNAVIPQAGEWIGRRLIQVIEQQKENLK